LSITGFATADVTGFTTADVTGFATADVTGFATADVTGFATADVTYSLRIQHNIFKSISTNPLKNYYNQQYKTSTTQHYTPCLHLPSLLIQLFLNLICKIKLTEYIILFIW